MICSLGAEHVVDFALNADGTQLDEATLRSIAGVRAARARAGGYELNVGELHRTVPALLGFLAQRKLELAQLTTHSATLEDVFRHHTGNDLDGRGEARPSIRSIRSTRRTAGRLG